MGFIATSNATSAVALSRCNIHKVPAKRKVRIEKKPRFKTEHSSRYQHHNEAFLNYLEKNLAGFKNETIHTRIALCRMIYDATTRHRMHSHCEGYSRFSWQELEQSFGRGRFGDINVRLQIFEILKVDGRENWSMVEGRTKAYKLTEHVANLRENFLRGCLRRRPSRFLMEDGKCLQKEPNNAIEAKNKDGQNRRGFQDIQVHSLVPVCLHQIENFIKYLQPKIKDYESGFVRTELFSKVPCIRYLKSLLEETTLIYNYANNSNWRSYMLHRYYETETGRIYAFGACNLQNCARVVREVAMAGMYDIDISNCHYSILAQMAKSYGYTCTEVLAYLSNKKHVRESLAQEFGISIQQVKDALIALIYGAKFSLRSKDALPSIFNSTETAGRIYQHPQFVALRNEIAKARKVILQNQNVNRRTIRNCRWLTMRLDLTDERQQLAHLLQGVEAAALEAGVRLFQKKIVLLQHDGFTATEPLDTNLIEAAIFESTGYQLNIEQKRIQADLAAAFDAHPAAHLANKSKTLFSNTVFH